MNMLDFPQNCISAKISTNFKALFVEYVIEAVERDFKSSFTILEKGVILTKVVGLLSLHPQMLCYADLTNYIPGLFTQVSFSTPGDHTALLPF